MPELAWTWRRFAELGVHNLYATLALRCRVFVVEQQCPYQDPDGIDAQCWHLLGHDPAGALRAYLRVVDPGVKYVEASIGRVVNTPETRGTGLGRVLMREGVVRCLQVWPGSGIRISAQAHLARFYGEFGFIGVGQTYLEDNIPHLEMLKAAP